MRRPIFVVLLALVVYAGLIIGADIVMIRPKQQEKKDLQVKLDDLDKNLSQEASFRTRLAQAKITKDQVEAAMNSYRATKMPAITFTGGGVYALQGLLFEQREDLGPIILKSLTSTGNTPQTLAIPKAELTPPTAVEPLAIPAKAIAVSFGGTWESTLRFLRELPAAPRVLALGDTMDMKVTDVLGGGKALLVNVTLQEYVFAPGATAAAAAAPGGAKTGSSAASAPAKKAGPIERGGPAGAAGAG